jgi:uncharacterized protein YyaL (SSP411 family)
MVPMMRQYPGGFSHWLSVLAFNTAPPHEIAVIGAPSSEETAAMLKVALGAYRPYQVVALAAPDDEVAASTVPLLADRPGQEGRTMAYVCQRFVCQAPVTDPAALERQIELQEG